jgi:putative flippase GtrA
MNFFTIIIQRILDFMYPFFKRILPYQVYSYLAVGGINTAINILIYVLLYEVILPKEGVIINDFNIASYTIALMISFFITIPTGFWLSKNFAFKTQDDLTYKNNNQLFKYFLVVSQGLGSDYILLKVCIELFNIQPSIAKIISTIIVLSLNFLLQKYFTFKSNHQVNQFK